MSLVLTRPINRPLIIAHRGYRACYPENTMLAFDRSLGRCDMIELDVRLSADGRVVVMHDELLDRTSDALKQVPDKGGSLHVRDWPQAQLRRLDAGSWFVDADPFKTLASGLVGSEQLLPLMPQRIPTLDEVLVWCRDKNLPLNIELKDLGNERDNTLLAGEVISRIRQTRTVDLILLSSFNHQLLAHCHRMAPEIARAALQSEIHPPALLSTLQALGVCAYHPEDAITDHALVRSLSLIGIAVNVFTVNDPQRCRQLHEFGVTGIITDYPGHPPFPAPFF
jgi:glycerophosphoryl diester phosphodiesterase